MMSTSCFYWVITSIIVSGLYAGIATGNAPAGISVALALFAICRTIDGQVQ